MGGNPFSVHPLGGFRMAEDRSTGVVNHMCEVFDGTPSTSPEGTHDGLYVCDGSVLPRGMGIHPLFTITACIIMTDGQECLGVMYRPAIGALDQT